MTSLVSKGRITMGELIETLRTLVIGKTTVELERNKSSSPFSIEDEYHLQTDRIRLDLDEREYTTLILALMAARSSLNSYKIYG